jgi:hypothetical protein
MRRRALWVALGFAAVGGVAATRFALDRVLGTTRFATAEESSWHVMSAQGSARPNGLAYGISLELVWVLVATFATWAGVARGRSMLGRSVTVKLAVAVLTPLALAASWFGLALAQLPGLDDPPSARLDLHCVLMSVAYAIGPSVALLAIRRGTDPIHPRWGGAAIGAVGGAWGAVLYVASCGCTSPIHIALAHVLPVALLAALGASAGERVLGFQAS